MGKVPVRLREVMYTLSPFEQSVMSGLWKDLPHKAAHHAANVRARAQPAGGGGACSSAQALACTWSRRTAEQRRGAVACVEKRRVPPRAVDAPPPPPATPTCAQARDAILFCVLPLVGIS